MLVYGVQLGISWI